MMQPPDLPKMAVDLCVQICGHDPGQGLVLWKIQYWHSRTRHVEGDKRWAKTTHAQLAEATGMTERRVKRSLQNLVDAEIVERKHGVHKSGLRCTHVRMTDKLTKMWWDATDEAIILEMKTGNA